MCNRCSGRSDAKHFLDVRRKCLAKRMLFVDDEFPPADSSLYFSRPAPPDIEWKRPKDITPDPKFFIDGASADDFSQGSLGNCWFVAAAACIAEQSKLWKKIIPDFRSQVFSPEQKYAGVFHFKFWRLGSWQDVIVDDFLPTSDGELVYCQSRSRNEFWSALLEKAYAKLFGSYEALHFGVARDAMVDMTGGVGEQIFMRDVSSEEDRERLFDMLYKAKAKMCLMNAWIIARNSDEMESRLSVGLIKGHSYSVTKILRMYIGGTGLFSLLNKENIEMVRLRNPWGGKEWNGAWSDGSEEWKAVSASQKKVLGLSFLEDGEFWMSFKDFCQYFTGIDICHMMNNFKIRKRWREFECKSQWKRPFTAGGCANYPSFLANPQYLLELRKDEDDMCISLERDDRRGRSISIKHKNPAIGFTIVKMDLNRKYRLHQTPESILRSRPFYRGRSVCDRFSLPRGRYCLIPSTFLPDKEGEFLLRVFTRGPASCRELVKDAPDERICCRAQYVAATAVTVYSAILNRAMKAYYCKLKCEGVEVRTHTSDKSKYPEWDERVTFYRKTRDKNITVEVWGRSSILRDSLVGQLLLQFDTFQNDTDVAYKGWLKVTKKSAGGRDEQQGRIWLRVKHTSDFMQV